MPVTRKFRTTIMDRALNDPAFRRQMLTEAVNELLAGDLGTITLNFKSSTLVCNDLTFLGRSSCV